MYNGKVIRKILRERNLLQKDLLEYLHSDRSNGSITQLENGNPTVKTLERIADFFHVSMDVFFERAAYTDTTKTAIDNDQMNRIESLQALVYEKERFIQHLLSQESNRDVNGSNSGQLELKQKKI